MPVSQTRTSRSRILPPFCSTLPRPPRPTLFPYTTLFRSRQPDQVHRHLGPQGHARPAGDALAHAPQPREEADRKSTRLNSSHMSISYAVFCLKKKKSPSENSSQLVRGVLP